MLCTADGTARAKALSSYSLIVVAIVLKGPKIARNDDTKLWLMFYEEWVSWFWSNALMLFGINGQ